MRPVRAVPRSEAQCGAASCFLLDYCAVAIADELVDGRDFYPPGPPCARARVAAVRRPPFPLGKRVSRCGVMGVFMGK
jgi:hypothetical protein